MEKDKTVEELVLSIGYEGFRTDSSDKHIEDDPDFQRLVELARLGERVQQANIARALKAYNKAGRR